MEASIKKIILATDFSDTAKDASSHALLLAKTYKAELKALHVFDINARSISSHDYLASVAGVETLEEVRQKGKDALKELAESFDLEVETIYSIARTPKLPGFWYRSTKIWPARLLSTRHPGQPRFHA